MKKKSKRARSCDRSEEQNGSVDVMATSGFKKPPASRGRTRKKATPAPHGDVTTVGKSKTSGRPPQALCRLCHGRFSPRSLRHAFNRWPSRDPDHGDTGSRSRSRSRSRSPSLLFHSDFQRLVGVPLDRDPRLSQFVCKKCHANFYKCHSTLLRFLQTVNLLPYSPFDSTPSHAPSFLFIAPPFFTADSKCLHSLVSWAHHHGEACRSCPDLKEVVEGQCWGSVRAVWGCVSGHSYIMDTQRTAGATGNPGFVAELSCALLGGGEGACEEEEGDEGEVNSQEEDDDEDGGGQRCPPAAAPLTHHSGRTDGAADLSIEEDFEEGRKTNASDDELFQPYQDKRPRRVTVPAKRRHAPSSREEPKVRGKPGPKPGWKNKFKPQGEELPNIYKCPYQGCTAVYRATDGLKKHIKEQHEENRERPCPYPGCNKIFMIDRYLQRHVKLIHTDERNYICDQCGQTFKQRKHLSVHQMRHSGAKPLQCEVCGFQCRQRASLKYHMTKHKAEADLEFACVLCSKRFEKAHNLNVHMSMVHLLTQGEALRGVPLQQRPTPSQLYSDMQTITETGEVVRQQDQER
ncbi:unnamed protein product [Merluccius merluccius]